MILRYLKLKVFLSFYGLFEFMLMKGIGPEPVYVGSLPSHFAIACN